MHDDPERRERLVLDEDVVDAEREPIPDPHVSLSTIVGALCIIVLVIILTSIIYSGLREHPGSFPGVFMPLQSEVPATQAPIKVAPQPYQTVPQPTN